jgi:putative CocE/NonD family hydrolase
MHARLAEFRRIVTVTSGTLVMCFLASAIAQTSSSAGRPQGPYEFDVQPNVFIAMRDGIRLATDLYMPKGSPSAHYPIVLMRTPYGNGPSTYPAISVFASHGYVVAVQDKRGKFRSEGIYRVNGGDAEDGFDTIEWLAKQKWSNGNIGMYGCSYLGDVQIFVAQTKPPALKALIPQASGSTAGSIQGYYRYFGQMIGGATEWASGVGWFAEHGAKVWPRLPADLDPKQYSALYAKYSQPPKAPVVDYHRAWRHLPMVDALRDQGFPDSDFDDMIEKPPTDPYWSQLPYMTDSYRSDVPALFVSSWYDFGVDVSLMELNWFTEHSSSQQARGNQYALIGPGTHCSYEAEEGKEAVIGSRPMGDTRFDYWNTYLTWFDYWLKGDQSARKSIDQWPKVRYFSMGENRWRDADTWPPRGAMPVHWYLDGKGRANSEFGDGTLSRNRPTAHGLGDSFTYDPDNPVPSLGGAMCCTGTADAAPGAQDQRPVEARDDVLVYTTEPLKSQFNLAGPVDVTLYVESSAVDTDFTVKLVDVYPDGRAFNVLESILRARYKDGFDREVPLQAGNVYRIHIPVGQTSNLFEVGHQIRLEVSSSNFPRFDRNLNVGGNNYRATRWVKAINKVFHSAEYPSELVLTENRH